MTRTACTTLFRSLLCFAALAVVAKAEVKLPALFGDHMVLQRNRKDLSDARFSGTSETPGTLKARVTRKGRPLPGLAAAVVGRSSGKAFEGRLQSIPTGGPYEIALWIEGAGGDVLERVAIRDVLVGDVWILAGQSNMQGCGRTDKLPASVNNVRAFFMNDRWGVAKELLHDFHLTVDSVHIDLIGGVRPPPATVIAVGPGLYFAQEMYRKTAGAVLASPASSIMRKPSTSTSAAFPRPTLN